METQWSAAAAFARAATAVAAGDAAVDEHQWYGLMVNKQLTVKLVNNELSNRIHMPQDGPEPLRVSPRAGRLVAYTAGRARVG